MPVSQDDRAPAPVVHNRLLALIPRFRWAYFAVVAVLVVLTFNGQWRVGRDSAAYRGLAHQLATTGKYVFRDKHGPTVYSDQQDTRYPGLPLILAGVEKVFGRCDAAAVLVIVGAAVLTLVATYALAKASLPAWLAVAVVFGLGSNGRFLEHAHEVLSDVPFLLGVVLTLWAFDRLLGARTARGRAGMLSALVLTLVFAASMRPTFWVFAVALVSTCVWGLWRPVRRGEGAGAARGRRLACGLTLGVLVVASVVFALVVDVRGKSRGYEGKLAGRLIEYQRKLLQPLPANAHELLEQSLPESFFGTQLGPGFVPVWKDGVTGRVYKVGFSAAFSLALIGAGVWLVRRNVLWGLTVGITMGSMMVLGSVPRYFVMVLPLLLIAWGLLVWRVSERFGARWAREAVVFVGLGVVVAPNVLHCLDLIREQRGYSRPQQGFKHVGFLSAYHGGAWAGVDEVARMIRENVEPGRKVIGPEATVLTYLSGRQVFGLGMFLPRRDRGGVWEQKIPRLGFWAAVFPDGADSLYNDKDVLTGRLIKMGMLKPKRTIATGGGYKLSEFEVVSLGLRGSKKGKLTATAPVPARGKGRGKGATTQAATQATTKAVKGKKRSRAATLPATQATTQPRKRGKSKKWRATTAPAAAVATQPGAVVKGAAGAATQPGKAGSSSKARRARLRREAAAATRPAGAVTRPATRPATTPVERAKPGAGAAMGRVVDRWADAGERRVVGYKFDFRAAHRLFSDGR